ncbi:MAG: DNA (cytosine-5-)-methyltransferase [Bacteroidota bacterium]
MKHGSLFSGIGGFDLAAEWMGWDNVFHCEIDEWNRKILHQHWPEADSYGNIETFNANKYNGKINILSGGFPCQDISVAGKQVGIGGGRSGLWSEYKRIAQETDCDFIVAENSPNLLNKGFERILLDLSEIGYDVQWECFSASWFGFPHERERVYIVANAKRIRWKMGLLNEVKRKAIEVFNGTPNTFDVCSKIAQFERIGNSDDIRINNGISFAPHRIKGCGNAVVPQIPYAIFKAIQEYT